MDSVHNVILTQEYPGFQVSSTTLATFGALYVVASSFNDFTNYATVFDLYRIAKLQFTFYPKYPAGSAAQLYQGLFHTVIDLDDETALTTIGQACDYSSLVVSQGGDTIVRTFEPHIDYAAYSGAFTSYANQRAPWIDCASGNVRHYGVKTAWTATSAVLSYDVIIRALVQFKQSR